MIINTIKKNYFNGEFVSYQITYVDSNVEKSVPLDTENTDYQEIQEWAAIEGNNITDPGA